MNETELDSMVVRLMGDGSSHEEMWARAEEAAKAGGEAIEQVTDEVEEQSGKFESFASGLVTVANLWKDFKAESLDNYAEAETVLVRLESTLKANGREVQKTSEEYQMFALAMQDLTTLGDEAILMVLRQAETFGLTGEAARKAATDAISLAAVTGSSAEAMIRMSAAMTQGNTERAMAYARMIPQLRGIKDEAEFVIRYNQLLAAGFATATAEVDTHEGRVKQLKEAYGNLQEGFGKFAAEGIAPVLTWGKKLVDWLNALPEPIKYVIYMLAELIVILAACTSAVIAHQAAWAMLSTVLFKALGSMMIFAVLNAGWVALGAAIVAVIAVMPTVIDWFTGASEEAERLKRETEELTKANEKLVESYRRGTQAMVELGAGDADALLGNIGETEGEMEALAAAKQALVNEQNKLKEGYDYFFNDNSGEQTAVAAKIAAVEKQIAAAKDRMNELTDAAHKALDPEQDFKLKGELLKLENQLRLEAEALNMSEFEAKLHKQGLDQLSDVTLANVRALHDKIQAHKDAQKQIKEEEKAQLELINANKRANEELARSYERDQQRARELLRGTMDDFDRYTEKIEEAQQLFDSGVLTEEERKLIEAKALSELEKGQTEKEKAAAKEGRVGGRVDVQAATFGSAEAVSRVAAFRDSLGSDTLNVNKQQLNVLENIEGHVAKAADNPPMVIQDAGIA